MLSPLQSLFKEIETYRHGVLSELQGVSSQKLNASQNNKWSISEILGHIITAEKLSLSYITKKINAINEVSDTGLWNEIKLHAFIISQRLPIKYKAPKNLGDKPPSFSDIESLERDWNDSRNQLMAFLENFPKDGLRKKIYRHPVMGRCNIIHLLKFFREHLIHHHPQIKRQL